MYFSLVADTTKFSVMIHHHTYSQKYKTQHTKFDKNWVLPLKVQNVSHSNRILLKMVLSSASNELMKPNYLTKCIGCLHSFEVGSN